MSVRQNYDHNHEIKFFHKITNIPHFQKLQCGKISLPAHIKKMENFNQEIFHAGI